MTIDASQLRQWLESRRDKAEKKLRRWSGRTGRTSVSLTVKAHAEFCFAVDTLKMLKELEGK